MITTCNVHSLPKIFPSVKVQLIKTNIENPSSMPLYSLALLPVGILTSLFGLFQKDRQECYIIINYLHCVFEARKELLIHVDLNSIPLCTVDF